VVEKPEQIGFVAVDADADKRRSDLRCGRRCVKQAFAEKLMKLVEVANGRKRKARGYDISPEMKAHGDQKARALREEGLRLSNLGKEELVWQCCTESRKVLLAGLLWKKIPVFQV